MRTRSRSLVAVLALLMLVPTLPGGASVPVSEPAGPASVTSVNSFVDDDNSRFEPFLETARAKGIVSGCNPPANDRVCPSAPMTRGHMVIMLARAIGLDPPSQDPFVTDDGLLGDFALGALTGAGIPTGCKPGRPCPDAPLTRGEMASLFSRAFRWDGKTGAKVYIDISGSRYRESLSELARKGGLLTCDSPVDRRLCPTARVRRDEAVFALMTVMGLEPAKVNSSPDPAPIGFGDNFDHLSLWDGRGPSLHNRVSLTAAGFRDSALRVTIPRGSHYGADFHLHLDKAASEEPDRLYFRYYLKLDADWVTRSSGKLPGFSGIYGSSGKGGYQSSPSNPGWSARLMFTPARGDDPRVRLGYYVYHLGQETRYGDGVGWNEAGKLQPGEWYCLEGQVDMNTPGLADGSLQAWVDGTPALDFSGLEFRRPDEPDIKIESFWFNVYYGGKQVSDRDLGLTIDEVAVDTHRVGCAAGNGVTDQATGDFDGDGYDDAISWRTCPRGACLVLETRSSDGARAVRELRDTAWFSLETHRFGATAGDVDGDGRDEIVYRGRCDESTRCWRVHSELTDVTTAGENWGDGARFSNRTGRPTLGDWDGDGLDDLAYQGLCGSDAHHCWRVHLSTGSTFGAPTDWGATPTRIMAAMAVDLSGDGIDDLLYRSDCGDQTCWFGQLSTGSGFDEPREFGQLTAAESESTQPFDFDGNGTTDLVSWSSHEDGSAIEVRLASSEGLGSPFVVARFDRPVHGIHLERGFPMAPIHASIQVDCEDEGICIEYLFGLSPRELGDADEYRSVLHRRLGLPSIS